MGWKPSVPSSRTVFAVNENKTNKTKMLINQIRELTVDDYRTWPEIGEAERFYGYVVGVGVIPVFDASGGEFKDLPESPLYWAAFSRYDGMAFWQVPDHALFCLLTQHFLENSHALDDWDGELAEMYHKVHIWKKDGKWITDLP